MGYEPHHGVTFDPIGKKEQGRMASNECECTCVNVISFGAERVTPPHTQKIIKKYSCSKQNVRENTN